MEPQWGQRQVFQASLDQILAALLSGEVSNTPEVAMGLSRQLYLLWRADEAGSKVKKKKKKSSDFLTDSQGTNEEEKERERVRFSVLALQQKAPSAEPQCSTGADSHPVRPIFTLGCGITGFSLLPRCFLPPLLQVNSWTLRSPPTLPLQPPRWLLCS